MRASLDSDAVWRHLQSVEDQTAARVLLAKHGLVAFVINGAQLARASGADDTVIRR